MIGGMAWISSGSGGEERVLIMGERVHMDFFDFFFGFQVLGFSVRLRLM